MGAALADLAQLKPGAGERGVRQTGRGEFHARNDTPGPRRWAISRSSRSLRQSAAEQSTAAAGPMCLPSSCRVMAGWAGLDQDNRRRIERQGQFRSSGSTLCGTTGPRARRKAWLRTRTG